MKNLLIRSINHNEKFRMIYLSNTNQISQRTIRVIRMNEDSILAYCYEKRKVRMFNLRNILAVELMGKRFGT
ncbi:WYL domain-containing protein [Oceanobacillus salinisoli]|uniref:hypothetical protein n=1 Tax=Oceanobacillus salinisoli TaxID=2678611 RepID=UPI0012E220A1|nr:hypothetical protein [Oceanobacillus salinisoli]